MFSGYRLAAIALGLGVTGALAQDAGQPTLESKPIAPIGQQQSASENEQPAAEKPSYADRFLSAVEGIEPAIRELVAEEDEAERKREEHRNIRDLQAQEEMALWAKRMFWATLASVFVTGVGIVFVWKTLKVNTDVVKQMRRSAVLDNPPKLTVQQISLPLNAGVQLEGRCFIINEGAHLARIRRDGDILRARITVFWGEEKLPQEHLIDSIDQDQWVCTLPTENAEIASGGIVRWGFSSNGRTLSVDELHEIRNGRRNLYVIGLILYGNKFDNGRGNSRTLFCRRFNPKTDRYEPVDDPYYEYRA